MLSPQQKHPQKGIRSSAYIPEQKGFLQFSINNFSKVRSRLQPGDAVTSQPLCLDLDEEGRSGMDSTKFALQVFPSGVSSLHGNHVSVALANLSNTEKQCAFSISILNQSTMNLSASELEKSSIATCNGFHTFAPVDTVGIGMTGKKCVISAYEAFAEAKDENEKVCSVWCVPELVFSEELMNNADPSRLYCVNDTVKFLCEVTVAGNICVEEAVTDEHRAKTPSPLPTLSTDLGTLFSDASMCDIHLVAGSTIVPAHRAILASRSPVFKRKFSQPLFGTRLAFQGNKFYLDEKLFKVHDANTSVLIEFVRFLYTDTVPITMLAAHSKSLLKLATKYEVRGLESLAADHLAMSLTPTEVSHIVRFALSDPQSDILKASCFTYINRHFSEVAASPSFKDLDADVMKSILSKRVQEGEVESGCTEVEKLKNALEDVQHEGHEASASCHSSEGDTGEKVDEGSKSK